jgi:hypothetical protein
MRLVQMREPNPIFAKGTAFLVLLLVVSAVLAACGTTEHLTLGIYDPTGHEKTRVEIADVVRSSVRASHRPDGSAVLFLSLNGRGAKKFLTLTRALARRGARVERFQPIAFEVNGREYARAKVDYRMNPDGIQGNSGFEFGSLSFTVAERLAKQIRES